MEDLEKGRRLDKCQNRMEQIRQCVFFLFFTIANTFENTYGNNLNELFRTNLFIHTKKRDQKQNITSSQENEDSKISGKMLLLLMVFLTELFTFTTVKYPHLL